VEPREDRTVMIAVITGLIALLLGICLGAVAGGLGGYFIGRGSAAQFPSPLLGGAQATRTPRAFVVPVPTTPGGRQATPQANTPNGANGATVSVITAGSPAESAGIRVGDIITAIDGQALNPNHQLADVVASHKPGDRVRLTVMRGGQTLTIPVDLGARAEDSGRAYLGVTYTQAGMRQATPTP
jgi:membrane-associated protease RseP (regulator of RpoE activity)